MDGDRFPGSIDLIGGGSPTTLSSLTSLENGTEAGAYARGDKLACTLNRGLVYGVKTITTEIETFNVGDTSNGFMTYKIDNFGDLVNSRETGMEVPENFVVQKVLPFHRKESALILMNDGTSTPKESVVIWVEKSKFGGIGGTEGTEDYKMMAYWRGKFDGFPEGSPSRMALSPDDSVLVLRCLPNNKRRAS